MIKADRGQVSLDGGRGLAAFLQVQDVGDQVLGGDVGQALQAVTVGQKAAKPLHGFVVARPCPVAALAVVPVQAVELGDQVLVLLCHI